MPSYFGYLRVSTDGQDVDSQRPGLLEYFPPGKTGCLKLEGQLDVIKEYIAIGLAKLRMAKVLVVAYKTLERFIERKELE